MLDETPGRALDHSAGRPRPQSQFERRAWTESERAFDAKQQTDADLERYQFHLDQVARWRANSEHFIKHHENEAKKYEPRGR